MVMDSSLCGEGNNDKASNIADLQELFLPIKTVKEVNLSGSLHFFIPRNSSILMF
jgi:hypothetical protein